MPKKKDDGECKVTTDSGVKNLTKPEQLYGNWSVIRGHNKDFDLLAC